MEDYDNWVNGFLARYQYEFPYLTLFQVLLGFKTVIKNEEFADCDFYFKSLLGEFRGVVRSEFSNESKEESLSKLHENNR